MECLGENASEVSLLLSEAPFPPLPLQEAMNEVRMFYLLADNHLE